MATPLGQASLTGIQAGVVIAVAPPALVILLNGRHLIETIVLGLLARAATEGRYNTAFNLIIVSPLLWRVTCYTAVIGSAISAISLIGFYYAEQRLPTRQDLHW